MSDAAADSAVIPPVEALKTICRSAFNNAPAEADFLLDYPVQWDQVWELAESETVTPWCLDFVSRHRETITGPRMESWRANYMREVSINQLAIAQLAEVVGTLSGAGIEVIALKGAAMLLWLYEDPGKRVLSDIDIHVHEERTLEALHLLEKDGYSCKDSASFIRSPDISYNVCLKVGGHIPSLKKKNKLPVEIHLDFTDRSGNWEKVKEDIWREKQSILLGDTTVYCLASHHAFIHAAIHFLSHYRHTRDIFFTWALDVAVMISRPGLVDWDKVWLTASDWEMTNHLRNSLDAISRFFHIPVTLPPVDPALPNTWQDKSLGKAIHALPSLGQKIRCFWELLTPSPSAVRQWSGCPDASKTDLLRAYWRLYAARIGRRL